MKQASGAKQIIMADHFLKLFHSQYYFIGSMLAGLLFLSSCQTNGPDKSSTSQQDQSTPLRSSNIRYAVGFDLIPGDGYQLLQIFRHYNETADTISYLLIEKGTKIPDHLQDIQKIQVPVMKIALLHSSYLSYFDFCKTDNHIKAISEGKYVYDDSIFQAVQDGSMPEVGYGETLDKEQLLVLGIDLLVTVGWPNSPNKNQEMLDQLGLPMLVFSDWQESTLLGRAEWVKVVAALTGKSEMADIKFNEIASAYDSLKALTANIQDPPKIVCNLPYKGSWYVPGGNSYMSHLLSDAGGKYLWSDDKGTGGLQLGFETVYAMGMDAEFLINPDIAYSIQDILDKDERLVDFKSVSLGNVYNSINKTARNQANDYWESGIVHPHLILADMIHILHPELLPKHELVYYKKIQ
jgi:iron complex transport system substrate-binding protein